MKNKEIEELLNDMRHSYEIHEEIIKKYNNADKISYPYRISLKQINLLLSHIEQLEKRNKQLYEGFMATQEELTDYATKNEQLENNRDKAIEILSGSYCTYDDVIKILKGDSDYE